MSDSHSVCHRGGEEDRRGGGGTCQEDSSFLFSKTNVCWPGAQSYYSVAASTSTEDILMRTFSFQCFEVKYLRHKQQFTVSVAKSQCACATKIEPLTEIAYYGLAIISVECPSSNSLLFFFFFPQRVKLCTQIAI